MSIQLQMDVQRLRADHDKLAEAVLELMAKVQELEKRAGAAQRPAPIPGGPKARTPLDIPTIADGRAINGR